MSFVLQYYVQSLKYVNFDNCHFYFSIMYRELKDGETKADLSMKDSTSTLGGQLLSDWESPRNNDPTACTVDNVLQLLQRLYALSMDQYANSNKFGKLTD